MKTVVELSQGARYDYEYIVVGKELDTEKFINACAGKLAKAKGKETVITLKDDDSDKELSVFCKVVNGGVGKRAWLVRGICETGTWENIPKEELEFWLNCDCDVK